MFPSDTTVADLVARFRRRDLSPREWMADTLRRAGSLGADLNAVVGAYEGEALEAATASEQRWMSGIPLGPLDGVPFTVKDNVRWKGRPCLKGSAVSDAVPAPDSAPVVDRLIEAGAIPFAITSMPDNGCKGVTSSPVLGSARNPWDTRFDPGGSSGGAAICAALGIGQLHIGTDAAGSIRIPAAFCGVVGLKPSFGLVPRHPPSPFRSLVHHGPIARRVSDVAAMLGVIAKPDARDIDALRGAEELLVGKGALPKRRIAWSPRMAGAGAIGAEVLEVCRRAVLRLEEVGYVVEETTPNIGDPTEILMALWHAGCASVLRRVPEKRWSDLDPDLVSWGLAGLELSATQLLDALNERDALFGTMEAFLDGYDALASPTTTIVGIQAGATVPNDFPPEEAWFGWAKHCYLFNLTQQPAISVPAGLSDAGLPIGLQLACARGRDLHLLRLAAEFESLVTVASLRNPRYLHEAATLG